MGRGRYKARGLALVLALGVMLAGRGFAQLEIGSNTNLTLSGDLGFGYNGNYGNVVGSSHGTNLNGDAVMQGYYYNPKFLNFFVDPIYNRSQANSGQGSITDASSVNVGANLFSGSHFPGTVSFSQSFDSSGNYGYGTTPGFTTTGNSHSFGLGWAELIPGAPPLNVQYSQNASASSIFGTDEEDHSDSKNLNVFSNYKLAGWYMGGHFTDTWTNTALPSAITGDEPISGETNGKVFSFNGSHKLPLRGSIGVGYAWSDFSGETNGSAASGSNQMISASAAFAPSERLTTSFQLNYNTSLTGEIEQQLLGAGAINPQVNLGTSSYSISLSNSDNVAITKSLSVGFNVGHIQQEVYGETVSATNFSAIVNYRFLKPLWGTVVIYAGVNDQATDAGNQDAGLVAGANFNKQWSNLELSGSFAYSQDTQTVLATELTSNYSYMANAKRRLTRRIHWLATFNGFHTGLEAQTGSSAHAESYGSQLIYKMYNVGANYSRSSGTALLTGSGLVVPPGGIPTGNEFLLNTGSSYSFSFTANPTRKLVVSGSYTRSISDSLASTLTTNSASTVYTVFTEYQFRKIVFNAGYTNLNQFVSAAGMPAANYSNFYVGIQRWFKAF
ncbi:MAG: hypothetical protein WB817_10265 [Terriglobales bacterium]